MTLGAAREYYWGQCAPWLPLMTRARHPSSSRVMSQTSGIDSMRSSSLQRLRPESETAAVDVNFVVDLNDFVENSAVAFQ